MPSCCVSTEPSPIFELVAATDPTLLPDTAQQMVKDFQLGAAFRLPEPGADYTAFFLAVNQAVAQLITTEPERFKRLLYTFDVQPCRASEAALQGSEAITGLLIKRALQKVVLRRRFSGGA